MNYFKSNNFVIIKNILDVIMGGSKYYNIVIPANAGISCSCG